MNNDEWIRQSNYLSSKIDTILSEYTLDFITIDSMSINYTYKNNYILFEYEIDSYSKGKVLNLIDVRIQQCDNKIELSLNKLIIEDKGTKLATVIEKNAKQFIPPINTVLLLVKKYFLIPLNNF